MAPAAGIPLTMRTLIRELPYERPIAAGRYRYERDGEPTGAIESWRLTAAQEGYHFLRVDLNAQAAESGDSYLYHLTLDAAGRPDRLSFRFFGSDFQASGNVLFAGNTVTLARTVDGRRLEMERDLPSGYAFWFPATAGLALLARKADDGETVPGATLDKDEQFALRFLDVHIRPGRPQPDTIMGKEIVLRPLTISWADQQRTIWLDQHEWPLKMEREGLAAVETRYIRYSQKE